MSNRIPLSNTDIEAIEAVLVEDFPDLANAQTVIEAIMVYSSLVKTLEHNPGVIDNDTAYALTFSPMCARAALGLPMLEEDSDDE